MQRFRLRAAAILIGLFLPALGVCASLTPPAAFAYCGSVEESGTESCCGGEAGPSCPAAPHAPANPRCRACEGLLTFAGEERVDVRAPEVAAPLSAFGGVATPPAFPPSPERLRLLSESPPLQLLHESLRN